LCKWNVKDEEEVIKTSKALSPNDKIFNLRIDNEESDPVVSVNLRVTTKINNASTSYIVW